jgi:hypothetical protein
VTTWTRDQATAALRRCVLNVASLTDGSWAPVTTDLDGKVFVRGGDESYVAAAGTLSNLRQPLVQADNTFTVDAGTDVVTLSTSDPATGSGPFQLTTTTTLPAPLTTATDYWWIRTGANTGKLATSLAAALAGSEVDITDTGTGTHTISDTADTEQLVEGKWLYEATQGETDVAANEVEVAVLDTTYYAQTLVHVSSYADVATAIWDAIGEGSHTYGDLMRGMVSVLMGKVENFTTGTLVFKGLDGVTTRLTSVRTAVGRITQTIGSLLP